MNLVEALAAAASEAGPRGTWRLVCRGTGVFLEAHAYVLGHLTPTPGRPVDDLGRLGVYLEADGLTIASRRFVVGRRQPQPGKVVPAYDEVWLETSELEVALIELVNAPHEREVELDLVGSERWVVGRVRQALNAAQLQAVAAASAAARPDKEGADAGGDARGDQ